MARQQPALRRAFDKVERKVGAPLEDAVASNTGVDLMLKGMAVQRAVNGALGKVAGGAVNTVLRAANLPTRRDVRDLSRQVTVLTSEIRALKLAQQDEKPAPKAAARSTTAAARKTPAARKPAAKRAPAKKKPAADA